MKSPRLALSRHIQTFFETELRGLYRFDQAVFSTPEKAALPEGWSPLRRSPYGKWRELIALRFGMYDLIVSSPNEVPPIGEIRLRYPGSEKCGPLDAATWRHFGQLIREREEVSNVA